MRMTKRFGCLILSMALVFGMFPATAFAAEGFRDVSAGDWYFETVHQVTDLNLMKGIDSDRFDPKGTASRAMLATVIWRADGSPAGYEDKKQFNDLTADWYKDAVRYMASEERISGYPDGSFRPDRPVTRAEAAVMFGKSAQMRGLGMSEEVKTFKDADQIPDWAKDSIDVCQEKGILKGYEDGTFRPDRTITRAELATMLQAFASLRLHQDLPVGQTYQANEATGKMVENLVADKQENYMISPLSLKMAAAMAANGAAGETRTEMNEALGLRTVAKKTTAYDDLVPVDEYYRDLRETYKSFAGAATLDLNNSIWINESQMGPCRFKENFEKVLKECYDAKSGVVNNQNAVKTVNDWVSEKTRGKIQNTLDSPDFYTLLVNTVYFKGRWADAFDPGATRKGDFTQADGTKVKTDLMHKMSRTWYYRDGDVQMIKLPYDKCSYEDTGNGYSEVKDYYSDMDLNMYVLLSGKPVDLAERIEDVRDIMEWREVDITLPKFRFEYTADMTAGLQKMGMKKAFSPEEADFSNMVDGPQWLDSVLQKTFISVDEEGTEAAAVTVMIGAGSGLPEEPVVFTADRPFQFAIVDDASGEILFIGAYNKVE
ncbi:MAG: S-layer homology domain-containing protein [Firmicutes bacterium]|nr:S-layer homology domain-containing protein [Bacillota bacterium]